MFQRWQQMSLPNRILIFIAIGVVVGLIMGPAAAKIKFIGDIFVNLILMMVFLLVIPALISGMTQMRDPRQLGNVGVTIFIIFLVTTIIAGVLALVLVNLLGPGRGLALALPEGFKYTKPGWDLKEGVVPADHAVDP